ncbi:hypothetical protein CPB86DRAFT_713416 [Serendipita vermifera]|nr:hypothetical protein CPB86DRAFT_713416 [Serendipita vermifera]
MLIEDDFPLCGGDKGWEAIVQVMEILERGRIDDEKEGKIEKGKIPERRAGFVGTGGSGFIIHHTLLPTLVHILRTHSDIIPKFTSGVTPRPPDVVVQDCLLGHDPICPSRREEGLIITSRLVLDHIGGLSSTNLKKAPNSDKWRCGWRHPFHGLPEVQVVAVEGMSWMD